MSAAKFIVSKGDPFSVVTGDLSDDDPHGLVCRASTAGQARRVAECLDACEPGGAVAECAEWLNALGQEIDSCRILGEPLRLANALEVVTETVSRLQRLVDGAE